MWLFIDAGGKVRVNGIIYEKHLSGHSPFLFSNFYLVEQV